MAKKQTQDYTDRFKQFANKVKSEPIKTPTQKVVPIITKDKKEAETPFNVYIKAANLKALKLGALQQDTNVKTLINQAIEMLLASGKTTPDTQEPKGKKEPEKPFHVLINAKNLKALKVKAIQEETTVKDLINRAIEGAL